jgi:Leucine Rich Repeat
MLQAFISCDLAESPAIAVLSQLTLLSLRGNCLSTLTDALPADAVQNLRVLDISGNPLGWPPDPTITYWRDANIAVFSGSWAQLQVLGIRPSLKVTGRIRATADTLRIKLRQQAAAAQPPRPPPIVVFSELREELLRPADELAVVVA